MRRFSIAVSLGLLVACSPQPQQSSTPVDADGSDGGYTVKLSISNLEPIAGGACAIHFEALNETDHRIGTAAIRYAAANAAGEIVADGNFVVSNVMPHKSQNGYDTAYRVGCADIRSIKNVGTGDIGGVVKADPNSPIPIAD